MSHSSFFQSAEPLTLQHLSSMTGSTLSDDTSGSVEIYSAGPLENASEGMISFLDNAKYAPHLKTTNAGAVIVSQRFAESAPKTLPLLINEQPYKAYAKVLAALFPTAMRPQSIMGTVGISDDAHVAEEAAIEDGVTIEAGCVIGPGVSIGHGSLIIAGAKIGAGVQIGRNCTIGANVTIVHSLLGDNVIVHAGTCIGQDGFGFAMGPGGHQKVAQIGRVIVQDNVEIGANTTVDRGANRDTIIGEGTKIDNLVQIAHNVNIGRHCVIVGLVGISGSATLGDYVVVAGQAGIVGHVNIGTGAQIGGGSKVHENIAPGAKVLGYPAMDANLFMRQAARSAVNARKSAKKKKGKG